MRPPPPALPPSPSAGNADALKILFDKGIPSMDPIRAPMALAVALVALRNTPLMLATLEQARPIESGAIDLLAEGFDMLEEDLEEEQFFVAVRKRLLGGAGRAPRVARAADRRAVLIAKLEPSDGT